MFTPTFIIEPNNSSYIRQGKTIRTDTYSLPDGGSASLTITYSKYENFRHDPYVSIDEVEYSIINSSKFDYVELIMGAHPYSKSVNTYALSGTYVLLWDPVLSIVPIGANMAIHLNDGTTYYLDGTFATGIDFTNGRSYIK